MSKVHSVLSPSSSHRWLNCTPSAMLEQEFENKTTEAAEEGTAAHAFCEHKLRKLLKLRSTRPVSDYDSDEMQECTDSYVDFVSEKIEIAKQRCKDPLVLIEEKVDFSKYVKGGFGTADCLIISDNELQIIDLKYGKNLLVDAFDNPQMKCYALGALETYEALYGITDVSMSIFQPRRDNVSTWKTTTAELKEWAENVLKPKAELALKGEGEYCCGSWCRFCRAAVRCRARAEEKLKLAKEEFKMPPLISDSEIEEFLKLIPDLTRWASDIQSYALDMSVNHGKKWSGFKVVEGKSIRKYKDEDAVIEKAKENGYIDIFKTSLITLTEMQKLMGKKKYEELLGDLIIKPKGKPVLVPIDDKRPAIKLEDAKNEFNEIKEGKENDN